MRRAILFVVFPLCLALSCSLPREFDKSMQPAAPDYSAQKYWSALPFRNDAADQMPYNENWLSDSLKEVDVFYIYPTLYRKGETWTADLADKKLNKRIDRYPVGLQASIFNQVGRVYAPRYRQAILDSYSDTIGMGRDALNFAYEDVKLAFEYYLEHYNQGRPIILASHSQGTTHSRRLLKAYFDNEKMRDLLVCAYVVGFGIFKDDYVLLEPCKSADDVHCYVTWASYKSSYIPDPAKDISEHVLGDVCINPVTWEMDTTKATGLGGILLKVDREKPFITDARIHENYLWVNTNTSLFKRKNELHVLDFNLFWHDVRKNVSLRVQTYSDNQ
jgi:hypothetical protein